MSLSKIKKVGKICKGSLDTCPIPWVFGIFNWRVRAKMESGKDIKEALYEAVEETNEMCERENCPHLEPYERD